MKRAYNFNAGPSAMPLEVLLEAQEEFLNYQNTGMSIIEMSHRSNEYAAMHAETKQLLRELMEIPEDYEIMFIQGGGSTQFLMTAANFHTKNTPLMSTPASGPKRLWQKENSTARFMRLLAALIRTTATFHRNSRSAPILLMYTSLPTTRFTAPNTRIFPNLMFPLSAICPATSSRAR